MPAVAQRMILDHELSSNGRAVAQTKRRRSVQLLICKLSYRGSSCAAVLLQEFKGGRLRR